MKCASNYSVFKMFRLQGPFETLRSFPHEHCDVCRFSGLYGVKRHNVRIKRRKLSIDYEEYRPSFIDIFEEELNPSMIRFDGVKYRLPYSCILCIVN